MLSDTWVKDHVSELACDDYRNTGFAISIGFKPNELNKPDTAMLYVSVCCRKCDTPSVIKYNFLEVLSYRGDPVLNLADRVRDQLHEWKCTHAPEDLLARIERHRIVFEPRWDTTPTIWTPPGVMRN